MNTLGCHVFFRFIGIYSIRNMGYPTKICKYVLDKIVTLDCMIDWLDMIRSFVPILEALEKGRWNK